jgi:hypothetical protein
MHSLNNQKWLPNTININLKEERKLINFNQEALAELIWEGKDKLARHRRLMEQFANDPVLKNNHFYYEMTREEKMEVGYSKMPTLYTKLAEDLTYKNVNYYVLLLSAFPTVLHHAMFELAVRYLGDDE